VTKTQSAGPINCLEHCATRVLHFAIVTTAAVLMFPLLLQTIISNQMRLRRMRGAWFSRLLRNPARRRIRSILSPGTHTGYTWQHNCGQSLRLLVFLGIANNKRGVALRSCLTCFFVVRCFCLVVLVILGSRG